MKMERIEEWLYKRKLLHVLRKSSRTTNVIIHFETDCMVFQHRETGGIFMKSPVFYAVKVSESEMVFLTSLIRQNSFVIFSGASQVATRFVIDAIRRSKRVISWKEVD